MTILAAFTLTLLGSLCLYLASPNQSWLKKSLPTPLGVGSGVVLILLAGWLWTQAFSIEAGIFTLLVLAMMALTVFPYLSLLITPGGRDEQG